MGKELSYVEKSLLFILRILNKFFYIQAGGMHTFKWWHFRVVYVPSLLVTSL